MISIGIVSEYRASFYAPHHDVMQGTRSVGSKSPWHEIPFPPTARNRLRQGFRRTIDKLIKSPILSMKIECQA